jgi:2-polyprenyl-6-methoxyphenol hydroxylase-like FAD-dependent oxidoreductase
VTLARQYDVVIVGGGIGGGALATVLARSGVAVLVLERELEYRDVVRGEWIAPWGVVDVQKLGLYELYRAAGGHHITRHVTFDEDVPSDVAEARQLNLDSLVPAVTGPLAIGHPKMCNLLAGEASRAGATVLMGVRAAHVEAGDPPCVRFQYEGAPHEVRPRLVVGADGRNGFTRKQVGIELSEDPPHHFFTGMLVEGADGWPDDLQCISTEGDVNVLVFPQGSGRVRLYLAFGLEQKGRLAGPEGPARMLDAFRVRSVPRAESLVHARPAGPCFVYPNQDTWTHAPVAPGVVLIGDAAGRNDPITGQGLSIAHRDVRLVSEVLLGGGSWSPEAFEGYAAERRERMRRLRFSARMSAIRDAEFTPIARARRHRLHQRFVENPMSFPALITPMIGPEALPADAYTDEVWNAFVNA